MRNRKAKRPRDGGESNDDSFSTNFNSSRTYHDLMVLLPQDVDKALRYLKFQQLSDRLEFLGYSSIALVHQVFGKPKNIDPDQIFTPFEQILDENNKKRKRPLQKNYRRLHAVIENLSDVAFFTNHNQKLFDSYDLVSIAPRTEAIFQAVCASALVNIITLEYTRGGLPFKLRPTQVQTAVDRNIALEILYSPSIHHLTHRKSMIQAIRSVESASRGRKLRLIVSSGGETNTLRLPGDIANVLHTLACLDSVQARDAQSKAASWVLEEAKRRGMPDSNKTVVSVAFKSAAQILLVREKGLTPLQNGGKYTALQDGDNNEEEGGKSNSDGDDCDKNDVEDGFITM